jgi:ligand-binding sensor protein
VGKDGAEVFLFLYVIFVTLIFKENRTRQECQEKTRKGKIRQDKTGQDRTRQDKTSKEERTIGGEKR